MSWGSFVVDVAAAAVKKIRNRPRAVARRARKAAQQELLLEVPKPEEVISMDAIKGGLKSKLVWLGLVQVAYGLFQLWATGALSVESAGPVVSGAFTMIFRAMTTQSLSAKGSAAE